MVQVQRSAAAGPTQLKHLTLERPDHEPPVMTGLSRRRHAQGTATGLSWSSSVPPPPRTGIAMTLTRASAAVFQGQPALWFQQFVLALTRTGGTSAWMKKLTDELPLTMAARVGWESSSPISPAAPPGNKGDWLPALLRTSHQGPPGRPPANRRHRAFPKKMEDWEHRPVDLPIMPMPPERMAQSPGLVASELGGG